MLSSLIVEMVNNDCDWADIIMDYGRSEWHGIVQLSLYTLYSV